MNDFIISQQALQNAADDIRKNFGDLTDLPHEFANTIANLYYRASACQEHLGQQGKTRLIEPFMPPSHESEEKRWEAALRFFQEALLGIQTAQKLVPEIRQMRMNEPEHTVQYTITYALDVLKYGIQDDGSKTRIRIAIERKFKTVYEIPDLLSIMRRNGLGV